MLQAFLVRVDLNKDNKQIFVTGVIPFGKKNIVYINERRKFAPFCVKKKNIYI